MEKMTMKVPDSEEIKSEFRVLETHYDTDTYVGGLFEGSHSYGDVIILRLYSITPEEDTRMLRIETRHHYSGQVVDHIRTEHELTSENTLKESGEPLEEFCRRHHYDSPKEEMETLIDKIQESDEYPL